MKSNLRKLALFLSCLSLACAVPQLLAKKKDSTDPGANEQKRAVQALNRLTFGPRPGDVQRVTAMGVDRWIDLQLHPEKISDSSFESRLTPFRTLHMSSKEIVEEFPDNQIIKQVMEGKKPMPSDPAKRAVFQVQIARIEEKIFLQFTTLGVKTFDVMRNALERESRLVRFDGRDIRVKIATLPDGTQRAKPEFDDLRRVAEETSRPLSEIRSEVMNALSESDFPLTAARGK